MTGKRARLAGGRFARPKNVTHGRETFSCHAIRPPAMRNTRPPTAGAQSVEISKQTRPTPMRDWKPHRPKTRTAAGSYTTRGHVRMSPGKSPDLKRERDMAMIRLLLAIQSRSLGREVAELAGRN